MVSGRTEKLDKDLIVNQMYEFGRRDVKLQEIAGIYGVAPETLSRYQKRHPIIRQAYQRGKNELIKALKSAGIKEAIKGNTHMLKYFLNNLTDYSETPLIDNSTKINQVAYVWAGKLPNNRNSVFSPTLSTRDSRKLKQVSDSDNGSASGKNGNGNQ